MNCYLDNFTSRTMKNGTEYKNFNCVLDFGNDEVIYLQGFRLMNGIISPPAFKRGARFYANSYTSKVVAEAIYKELEKLGETLATFDLAVQPMILTATQWVMNFPNLAR